MRDKNKLTTTTQVLFVEDYYSQSRIFLFCQKTAFNLVMIKQLLKTKVFRHLLRKSEKQDFSYQGEAQKFSKKAKKGVFWHFLESFDKKIAFWRALLAKIEKFEGQSVKNVYLKGGTIKGDTL